MAKVVDSSSPATNLILGTSEFVENSGTIALGAGVTTRSHFRGIVVVDGGSRTIEIKHYVGSGNGGTQGLGINMLFEGTDASIYSEVLVIKIR